MAGEHTRPQAVAIAHSAGEHADRLKRELVAAAAARQDVALAGSIPDVTPGQVMAQLGESLSKAVGRMDDVSLTVENHSDGTTFKFRAYRR